MMARRTKDGFSFWQTSARSAKRGGTVSSQPMGWCHTWQQHCLLHRVLKAGLPL